LYYEHIENMGFWIDRCKN